MSGKGDSSKKRVTIKDITAATGYSIATVSRVLNQTGTFYNDETSKKVLRAAAQLGYIPNAYAKSLKSRKSNSIAFLVPQLDDFYGALYSGMQEVAGAHNYSVIIHSSNYDVKTEAANIDNILQRCYDGLVIATGLVDPGHMEKLRGTIPIVFIERAMDVDANPYVTIDDARCTKQAVEHLIGLGHRRIAYVSAPLQLITLRERYEGYCEALGSHGITLDERIVFFDAALQKTDYGRSYQLMRALIQERNFTAMMLISDFAAIAGIKAATDLGIRVPEQLSLVGFDDIPAGEYITPGLTTVSQDKYWMGQESVRMLRALMNGEAVEPIVIPGKLKIRQSTGRCPQAQ